MIERPKIEIKCTQTDKIVEAVGYLTLVVFWVMNAVAFSDLPEIIPIHYNGAGEVDGYGSRTTIFLLPIIGTLLFTMLTVLNKYPENFNYMVAITEENAEKQYANATRMIRFLKLVLVVLFFLIDFCTIQTSKEKMAGLGPWFLPILIVSILMLIGYFSYQSYRLKK
ncbi:DUF1648 domain-containing protein [Flavobacterium enshiense]|uniref:DUF1648 domain-containing protein n=1 Tax=Flavobacterium enshiense TaxID=1341165 RepID=UPI00345D7AF4